MRINKTQIFLTNLEAYNNGNLRGEWVELGISDSELKAIIKRIAGSSEYFITDYEANFTIEEFENIQELNNFIFEYNKLNEYEQRAVEYLISEGNSKQYALENYQDVEVFEGTYTELANQFVDEGVFGEIPETIANYIDYEAIARDLQFDYVEHEGFLFRN